MCPRNVCRSHNLQFFWQKCFIAEILTAYRWSLGRRPQNLNSGEAQVILISDMNKVVMLRNPILEFIKFLQYFVLENGDLIYKIEI